MLPVLRSLLAACPPANYSVDENGDFIGFMTEAEIEESYRQAGEAALARAEEEGWIAPHRPTQRNAP